MAYPALALMVIGLCGHARGAEKEPGPDYNKAAQGLVKSLRESPGCLGVETAQTLSGKSVIFAFFENKKAAMKWYFSPTHRELMELLGSAYQGKRTPMKGVPDDVPGMAVASLTRGGKPVSGDSKLPVSQISI